MIAVLNRVAAWAQTPKGRQAITIKGMITLAFIAVEIAPHLQPVAMFANFVWLWVRLDGGTANA